MGVTVLKIYFQKAKPRLRDTDYQISSCRDYRHFASYEFRVELIRELSSKNVQSDNLAQFASISKMVLEKMTSLKEKCARYIQNKFIWINLQKAIMNRSRLLNRYRNEKTEEDRSAYKRQKNFCVKLLRNRKKKFGNNLYVKYFTENFFRKPKNLLLRI